MTNDTSTLNGLLLEMKDQLIYELNEKGVTVNYDSSTGLLGLIDKIGDIEQGQGFVSFDNITTEFNYTRKRGDYGFSVDIPSGVTSLGMNCFNGCTGLTSVTIPNGVTSLGNYCFSGCSGLTNITIPSGITSLRMNCFDGCSGLTNVTIPNGVTSLGYACFRSCSGLTSIIIPSGVTSLENYCFSGCSGLISVTIPNSVRSLGVRCFSDCPNLVDYQLYWETPPVTWNANLMPNNANTYFTIPNGTTANYTAKGFPSDKLIEAIFTDEGTTVRHYDHWYINRYGTATVQDDGTKLLNTSGNANFVMRSIIPSDKTITEANSYFYNPPFVVEFDIVETDGTPSSNAQVQIYSSQTNDNFSQAVTTGHYKPSHGSGAMTRSPSPLAWRPDFPGAPREAH